MWRLFNKLFGWQYVVMSYGGSHFIRRIHYSACGQEYVIVYGNVLILSERKPLIYLTKEEEQNG